jgi:hypothetical protein
MANQLVNRLVGIPWKKGGRDPVQGFDCWGFFKWFYREFVGLVLSYDYPFQPGDTKNIVTAFKEATCEHGGWKKLDEPEQHCAVALSMNRRIHHVGVWFNGGCLHATEGVGVVYNDLKQLKRNGYSKVEFYTCKPKLQ